MALSFIGKPISLISHSDVRYRGILAGIDPVASTIQLSNVYSMGTESRRPPNEFIPPVQDPYEYIIFRASEVKDLAVDEPVPQRSVHDDPAVLGASAPGTAPPAGYSPYPAPSVPATAPGIQPPQQPNFPRQNQQSKPTSSQPTPLSQTPQPQPQTAVQQQQQQPQRGNSGGNRRAGGNSVQNAAASLESVERALGDLRVNNNNTNAGGGRGGRRGGAGGRQPQQPIEQIKVPTTDFDFESMNAKFNKVALAQQPQAVTANTEAGTSAEGAAAATEGNDKATGDATSPAPEKKPESAYNPQTSFFDSLSSSTAAQGGGAQGGGGRGRRGGGGGRNRREEERERNVATFGEPGGVGLMGPGAYVGGWGGSGRRGGRPRRGQGNPGQTVSTRG